VVAKNLKNLREDVSRGGELNFEPGLPELLLAMKRDGVLKLRDEGSAGRPAGKDAAAAAALDAEANKGDPPVLVKEQYRTSLWELMGRLTGGWSDIDVGSAGKRKKMRLFMTMFTMNQDFFQPLLLEMFPELNETLLQQLELMVTPQSDIKEEDVSEIAGRVIKNADPGTDEWIKIMRSCGSPFPVRGVLALIGNSVENVWESYVRERS
jgi:hypothetical protein